jgi:flagellar L-ring protein precursor FlgH
MRWLGPTIWLVVVLANAQALAQSSSLWRAPENRLTGQVSASGNQEYGSIAGSTAFSAVGPKETSRPVTRTIEAMSLIAIPSVPARKFKINDLIAIIVRQQKKYEADGKLDTKKEWDVTGKLKDWFRFYPHRRLGTDQLSNGDPGFDFEFENELKSKAKNNRKDKFTTRIQATIIDVKPNGNLVLEATTTEEHDEERFTITLTGMCRSEDVTPDNSILSTQLAELVLIEKNSGAVRDATRRGWIPKALDWLRPF